MKRTTMATQSTNLRYSSMVEQRHIKPSVRDSTSRIDSNSKGSRVKTHGSKIYDWQGSKRQESKDVTRTVIGRECPAASYVSSFHIWNFAGFLSGRIIYA